MTVETDFRTLAIAYAPLVALVDQNVTQNGVDEGTDLPYVVFTTGHDRTLGLDGSVHADQVSISVECWAPTAAAADAVADAMEAALALAPRANGVTVTGRASGYDGDLGLDATVLTVEWWA